MKTKHNIKDNSCKSLNRDYVRVYSLAEKPILRQKLMVMLEIPEANEKENTYQRRSLLLLAICNIYTRNIPF